MNRQKCQLFYYYYTYFSHFSPSSHFLIINVVVVRQQVSVPIKRENQCFIFRVLERDGKQFTEKKQNIIQELKDNDPRI